MAVANTGNTSPLPLDGRVALVTGGSRGIGREVSSHLAALGARIVVNYASNSARADELVAELASRGHQAVAVRADVSDPDAVRALFDRAEDAFGSPPHIVVACAGVLNAKYPALADTAVEDFDAMFAVNVRGTFLVCREAASRVPANSEGRIVTFSSSIVGTLLPGYAAYTAGYDEDPGKGGGGQGGDRERGRAGARAHRAVLGRERRGLPAEGRGAVYGTHRRGDGRGAGGGVPGERRRVLGERAGHQSEWRVRLSAPGVQIIKYTPMLASNRPWKKVKILYFSKIRIQV